MATAYVCALFLLGIGGFGGCGSSWKGSVGAVLGKDNRTGRVFVREAPGEMGAARAGIRIDDEIVAIDGVRTEGMTPAEIHDKLAGDVGSKVTLTVRHEGSPPRDVVVERGPLRPWDAREAERK
jgi:C-terminal processing protease CtpA/Prc